MDSAPKISTSIDWKDAVTLEELIRERFEKNRESDLIQMIKLLPPGLREKCRKVWSDELEKRKKKNGLY